MSNYSHPEILVSSDVQRAITGGSVDGSWTEWGNLVDAPIERGAAIPVSGLVAHAR